MAFNSEIKGYMTFGKSFSRGGAFPLEAYEIWTDYDELVAYAANTDPAKDPSYIGQKVTYVDLENNKVTHYGIEIDGSLKELGTSLIGDEKSIVIGDNNTISLKGIDSLTFERDILGEDGQPTGQKENIQFQPLMTKDGLIWVEPSKTTVEGLASLIDGLTARVSALENDRVTEQELADAVKAETDRATAAEEALGKRIDEIDFVDADELATAISGVEAKIPTNNNQLENGAGYQTADDVSTAIENKASKADTLAGYGITDAYTKTEVDTELAKKAAQTDLEALEGRVDAFLTGTGATDALDSLQELITYINEHDDVELADIIADVEALQSKVDTGDQKVSEYVTAAIEALKIGDYAKSAEVETALAGKVDNTTYTADKETFAIKSDVETALSTKVDSDTYATDKATLQNTIDSKVSKVSSEYGGEQVEWTLLSPEDQAKLAALVIGGEGNIEVSGTVKAENVAGLGSWITTNRDSVGGLFAAADETKLDGIETGAEVNIIETVKVNGTALAVDADRAVNVTVPTKFSDFTDDSGFDARITAAKSAADDAASAVITLAEGQVATNKTDIATLNTQLTATNTNVTNVTSRVATLETAVNTTLAGKINAVESSVETLSGTVGGHTTEIATLKNTTIPALQGEVDALETKFKDYSTTTQMNSAIAEAIAGVDAGKLAEDIAANTAAIEAEVTRATGVEEGLRTDVDANAAAIKALNGYVDAENVGDTGKSVRAIAQEEIAALVGEAPETLDTIHEIASWIENDETGAAAMATKIEANSAILAGLGGEGQPTTVTAAIATAKQEAIDAASFTLTVATADALGGILSSTGDNKVSVDADGVASVASVNVNTLTQTEGDVLILNGGSAV